MTSSYISSYDDFSQEIGWIRCLVPCFTPMPTATIVGVGEKGRTNWHTGLPEKAATLSRPNIRTILPMPADLCHRWATA